MAVSFAGCTQYFLLRLASARGGARAKEIVSLSLYKGDKQDIRLLSEARPGVVSAGVLGGRVESQACLYISGLSSEDQLQRLQRRLAEVDMQSIPATVSRDDSGGFLGRGRGLWRLFLKTVQVFLLFCQRVASALK